MALDPSEVEIYHHGTGKWVSLRTAELQTVATMRKCEFRLVGSSWELPKPKRSRVQEMAESRYASPGDFAEVIRAVCEYLRVERASSHSEATARAVEREFLEPR